MSGFINQLKQDIAYIFLNYFIAYIPFWCVRKCLYRFCGMKIGKGSRIAMRCIVSRPSHICIGRNDIVNEFVLLDGRGGLTIGDNNSISMFAKLYTGTHNSSSNSFDFIAFPSIIHNNCWIGTGAVIMPGSRLNDFSIISVNSVFKGESEIKGVYMGVPAVKTKERRISESYDLIYKSMFR